MAEAQRSNDYYAALQREHASRVKRSQSLRSSRLLDSIEQVFEAQMHTERSPTVVEDVLTPLEEMVDANLPPSIRQDFTNLKGPISQVLAQMILEVLAQMILERGDDEFNLDDRY